LIDGDIKGELLPELGVLLAADKLTQGQQSFVAALRTQPEGRLLAQVSAAFRGGKRGQDLGCPGRRMHAQGSQLLVHCPAAPGSAVAQRSGILRKLAQISGTLFRLHIGQPLKRNSAGIKGASHGNHARLRNLAVVKAKKHIDG
jgi:hypothetical protein